MDAAMKCSRSFVVIHRTPLMTFNFAPTTSIFEFRNFVFEDGLCCVLFTPMHVAQFNCEFKFGEIFHSVLFVTGSELLMFSTANIHL